MNPNFLSKIGDAISSKRLSAYEEQGGDNSDIEVLTRYIWNMRLCEAFYPVLQSLEIVLRNSLHESICRQRNNAQWLRSSCSFLRPREQKLVKKAEGQLYDQGKRIEADRLVAELTFGFWTSLLNIHCDHQHRLWPYLIVPVFPYAPKHMRKRVILLSRLDNIRHFRNRIFHHETIWYFPDLCQAHDDIMETIGWISPEMHQVTGIIDGFPRVCQQSYREEIKQKLLASIK